MVPDLGQSLNESFSNFNISILGVFNSVPIVIFAFMYQPNIPMVYYEIERKDLPTMWKVLTTGTIITTVLYMFVGIFGYSTFVQYPT